MARTSHTTASRVTEEQVYRALVVGFAMLSILPRLFLETPIGQDTPLHLFLGELLAGQASTSVDGELVYELHQTPRPYGAFYWIQALFEAALSAELGVKLALSLPLILTAIFCWTGGGEIHQRSTPFSSLLLFPLSYSATYYFGFVSYNLAVVLLLFALRTLLRWWVRTPPAVSSVSASWNARLALVAWPPILLLAHSYVALVYFVLALLLVATGGREGVRRLPLVLGPVLASVALLGLWWLLVAADSQAQRLPSLGLLWQFDTVARLAIAHFTGMQSPSTPDALALLGWMLVVVALVLQWVQGRKIAASHSDNANSTGDAPDVEGRAQPRQYWLAAGGLCLLGALVLPFTVARYSYFNTRLLSIALPLFALAVGGTLRLRLSRLAMVGGAAVLALGSLLTDTALDRERAEITALTGLPSTPAFIDLMPIDTSSFALDDSIFFQYHSHDVYLLFTAKGGGFSPHFIGSELLPAQIAVTFQRPLPRWESVLSPSVSSQHYPWLLSRGLSSRQEAIIASFFERIDASGQWELWRSRRL